MLKFIDAAETMISREDDAGNVVVIEAGDPRFAEWLALGPAPFVPEPEIDPVIIERAGMVASRFQARAALHQAGMLDTVERLISESTNFLHKMAWAEAVEFRRDSPTIAHLADTMALDDLAIDELFRLAMSIRA